MEEPFLNIQELKKIGIQELTKYNIDDAVIKANVLLQFVLNMEKAEILINSTKIVNENNILAYLSHIKEIINGRPIQYITNNQSFMGIDFYVDENVLIPQPDTELLVEETIKKIEELKIREKEYTNSKGMIRILDLCTGSGAIAISIGNYIEENNIKKIEIYASDISKKALEIARKNNILNNKNINIKFINSDMFKNINEKFDIIVSNPPYIEQDIIPELPKEVQNEPHIALDGGDDGLNFYRIIAEEGRKYLNENGYILLEIGYNQKESVGKIFSVSKEYCNIKCLKDLSGNNRVVEVQFSSYK